MTDSILRLATFIDKGGTGKTTTAAHLGVGLDRLLDGRVLLIDLAGKQGDLGKHFGVWEDVLDDIEAEDGNDWPNVSTVFDDQWPEIADRIGEEQAVDELVVETGEGPDLIPAHPGLDSLDADLGNIDDAADRYSRLDAFVSDYVEPLDRYSAALVDLPGLTNNVSINGLFATESVVTPVEMGAFEFQQVNQLAGDLDVISARYEPDISLSLVLPNRVRSSTTLSEDYLDQFADEYPEAIAPEPVPLSQDIRNAAESGRTVFDLDSPSPTAQRAREAFEAAAEMLVDQRRVEA